MAEKILIRRGDKELGEFDIDEVARQLGDGRLQSTDEFLGVGAREWQPLSHVLGDEADADSGIGSNLVVEFQDSPSAELYSSLWKGIILFGMVAMGAIAAAGDLPLSGRPGILVLGIALGVVVAGTGVFLLLHAIMIFVNEERPRENSVNFLLAVLAFCTFFVTVYVFQLIFLADTM